MPFTLFNVNSPLEVVAGRIHLQRFYTVVSLYIPPNTPADGKVFYSLFRQFPPPFLVLGDFNGRHPLWGDSVTNPRGTMLAAAV